MRYRAAIPLFSVFLGLLLAGFFQSVAPAQVTLATTFNPNGYKDFSFFYNQNASRPTLPPSLIRTPTGEKPQSKLWYNDGRWWANMFAATASPPAYHIFWLNTATQTWVDTGVATDTRSQTKADCLWDGTHLYIASGGGSDSTGSGTLYPHPGWLYRYSYNAATKTYTPDFGPILIRNGGAETLVIDKDTTGRLWITYTQNFKVYVNHSRTSDADWDPSAAMVVPTPDPRWSSLSPDDISSLIAFDGKIGVLWSNQSSGQFSGSSDTAFYFAYHVDGASDTSWTSQVVYRQPSAADDHINLKALQADPSGNVFAMVKTSLNSGTQTQLMLVVGKKQSNGSYTWTPYVESTRNDNQTRPLLLIDTSHRKLYVFTSDEGGGSVRYKSTSIDNIRFESGAGDLFMSAAGYAINNVTSTKQTVNNVTGIAVLASHDNEGSVDSAAADFYFHNYLDLSNVGPTVTPDPRTPTVKPSATPVPPTATPRPVVTPTVAPNPNDSRRSIFLPVVQQ